MKRPCAIAFKALRELDERSAADLRRRYDSLDEVLDVRQHLDEKFLTWPVLTPDGSTGSVLAALSGASQVSAVSRNGDQTHLPGAGMKGIKLQIIPLTPH